MSEALLPAPTRTSPIRDDHAWHFPSPSGSRVHVRLRVWPTRDGGHLAVATELMLVPGLINVAESLCRAVAGAYGEPVAVVRHFPSWTMTASTDDTFELLTLDDAGHGARIRGCTDELLALLGPQVCGFPGDAPPGSVVEGSADAVGPQSVYLARTLAALERLTGSRRIGEPDATSAHSPVARADLDGISQVKLGTAALGRLADFLAEAVVDEGDTKAGAKREKQLARIVATLHRQRDELTRLCDDLVAEERLQI